jgi:hypothetical protein
MQNAEKFPLTMDECAREAEMCLSGNLKADALCIGNIDEKGANEVTDVIIRHFMDRAQPLSDSLSPKFKPMKMPTRSDAVAIFGLGIADETIRVKYQEVAYSSWEENNAVKLTRQAGCDFVLGYE